MPKNQILFFATKADIKRIVVQLESTFQVKYTRMGLFDKSDVKSFSTALDVPNLGVATKDSSIICDSYLVTSSEASIVTHERPQIGGGIRFELSQFGNPGSVVFQPAGVFENGVLINGRVGSIHEDARATELFKAFGKHIRKLYTKFGSYYVGAEAESALDKGWRLAGAVQSPVEYDLRRTK